MSIVSTIANWIPEVTGPKQKKVSFNTKLKWTLAMLVLFYVLGMIPLAGLSESTLDQFQFLSVILAAQFGSIVSLGIGPIVTASIVLQLVNGAGILKFDTTTPEGKQKFQDAQKLLAIAFILLEAVVFVALGGLRAHAGFPASLLMLQLVLGGFMILFMDQVVSKWGFGSGLSLFIAAGVSQQIFVELFSPQKAGGEFALGKVLQLFQTISVGDTQTFILALVGILATVVIFGFVVYVQAMKVEIPLSFGRVRGHGIRWPLNFLYTSNIPVILIAALIANIQLLGGLLGPGSFLGNASSGTGILGAFTWPRDGLIGEVIRLGALPPNAWMAVIYLAVFMGGSVLFSMFWVQTSGLDARSQAKQMMASGFQVPGFRRDIRVLERLLERYIKPLTVMGGLAVGFIAASADLIGAIGSGTGILLTVMIVYRLYEEIAQQHVMDMNPAMRKFLGK